MVQGVGFRFFATRAAGKLGITGYVKNLADGRVEVYAIGSLGNLASLRQELERGPRSSFVSEVGEEDAPLLDEYLERFEIERSGW
jgi:acylphosphatase